MEPLNVLIQERCFQKASANLWWWHDRNQANQDVETLAELWRSLEDSPARAR